MESDVMDAEGYLHQKPRDVGVTEDVMDDNGSLYRKPREVCITEDVESTDLGGLRTRSDLVPILK